MQPITWRGRRCERPLRWLEAAESVVSGRSAPAAKMRLAFRGLSSPLQAHGWFSPAYVLCPQANFAVL
jgi:hypothetical protein